MCEWRTFTALAIFKDLHGTETGSRAKGLLAESGLVVVIEVAFVGALISVTRFV